ncbi:hypothetical protein RND71_009773 [Anisodus tanguticus]|uniref:RNase H type-1 domain-containing protein n=1 Tax=Anisodus tanguticus TaxID=243964 RepID=A0AAE1VHI8_9SOLA|nr:hypothetical protein RND71_009773 [Anisodus tanguticus]
MQNEFQGIWVLNQLVYVYRECQQKVNGGNHPTDGAKNELDELDLMRAEVVLESDSKLVIDMIHGKNKPPWHLEDIIKEIKELSNLQHCYREANQIADALSKWSHTVHDKIIYQSRTAIRPYQMYRLQVPALRRQVTKTFFTHILYM